MPITIKPMTEKQRLWYNEGRLDERRRIVALIKGYEDDDLSWNKKLLVMMEEIERGEGKD